MTRFFALATLLALSLAAAPAALAQTAGTAEAATPTAAPVVAKPVVKLEIAELVDEKASHDQLTTFRIRAKLREAGFIVWTEKPLEIDEVERRKKEKDRKPGDPPAAPDERPTPDLVVKGKVEVKLSHNSTFYGQNVAYIYNGNASLKILDPTGKEVGTVDEHDEWGKTEEKPAREECTKRIAAWTAAGVLRAEPVHSRIPAAGLAAADKYIQSTAEKKK